MTKTQQDIIEDESVDVYYLQGSSLGTFTQKITKIELVNQDELIYEITFYDSFSEKHDTRTVKSDQIVFYDDNDKMIWLDSFSVE